MSPTSKSNPAAWAEPTTRFRSRCAPIAASSLPTAGLAAARGKKGQAMKNKLASELIAASENQGEAVKKKADVQRMAEANRAFAHFAR